MAKFKVGDWVVTVGSDDADEKMQVLEILEQTCYAGTQVHYTVRMYLAHKRFDGKTLDAWHPAAKTAPIKFLEIELRGWVDPYVNGGGS